MGVPQRSKVTVDGMDSGNGGDLDAPRGRTDPGVAAQVHTDHGTGRRLVGAASADHRN